MDYEQQLNAVNQQLAAARQQLDSLQQQLDRQVSLRGHWHTEYVIRANRLHALRCQRRRWAALLRRAAGLAERVRQTLPAVAVQCARDTQIYGNTTPVATCAVLVQNAIAVFEEIMQNASALGRGAAYDLTDSGDERHVGTDDGSD